ncbi:hypothetical protein P389DRAFT_74319 [Cystobasidium minutum MCA 4210]|uniref:uncharacterized protein n=1 Tax=Cystobasidium minutum MCA 4210 TaxID=1397322 RepID=UPI0034CD19D0|eukprot:jgi/Rhomi1/74319/CE74318_308
MNQLIRIMFNTIDYLTKKATFKQVNPEFPITQTIPDSEDPKVFNERKQQLAEQLLYKAKEMELLISILPSPSDFRSKSTEAQPDQEGAASGTELQVEDSDPELMELENEMQEANKEYLNVLDEAENLYSQLQDSIRSMLDEHHQLSSGLIQQ